MAEYEISTETFYSKNRDDIRALEDVSIDLLDKAKVEIYLAMKQKQRPNLALLEKNQQYELNGITRQGRLRCCHYYYSESNRRLRFHNWESSPLLFQVLRWEKPIQTAIVSSIQRESKELSRKCSKAQ